MIILIKSLQAIFRVLFFLPAGMALFFMGLFARMTWAIARMTPLKKMTAENIQLVIPGRDTEAIADKLIRNTSSSIFELICLPYFSQKHFSSIMRFSGLENLKAALARGSGAIVLSIHAGNYEIIPAALANMEDFKRYGMNSVLRATSDPLFEILNRSRSRGGVKLINILGKDMYKESLKALGQNEVIFLLADTGALESRHLFIDFLGRKVPVATGWLTLAQRIGCPVIPILAKRENGINIVKLYDPVRVTKDNREEIMRGIGKIFEDFISQNPESWAMFLNSYETRRMVGGK